MHENPPDQFVRLGILPCLILVASPALTHADPVTGWVSVFDPQNNSPRFVGTTASTNSPVTTDADQDSIAANFTPVSLANGDFITLTGSVSFDAPLASTQFRIGLFNGDDPVTQDDGTGFPGIFAEAPAATASSIKAGDGTSSDHPFNSTTATILGSIPGAGFTVPANTPVDFTLTVTRSGDKLDIDANFTDGGAYNQSASLTDQTVAYYTYNCVAFLMGGGLNASQGGFSNIELTTGTVENPDAVVGWVSLFDPQGNTPRFVGGSETTNSPVTTDADQDSIAANFTRVDLADNEFIQVTGSVSFSFQSGTSGLASGQFRVGLFNGPPVVQDSGSGYTGFFVGVPTGGSTSSAWFGNGTYSDHPFSTSAGYATTIGDIPAPGTVVGPAVPLAFTMTLTRFGSELELSAGFTATGFSTSAKIPAVNVAGMGFSYDTVAFLMGGAVNGSQAGFSNIEVTTGIVPPDPDIDYGTRILGIDFNRDDALGSPEPVALPDRLRVSPPRTNNAASYTKTIGARQVDHLATRRRQFEFRGANGDSSRAIPGGDTSLSFLVADFIATREGALDIGITDLPAGNYIFRSYHLDTFTGSGLGFAQGSSTTTPNTIEARIGGVLQGSRPTHRPRLRRPEHHLHQRRPDPHPRLHLHATTARSPLTISLTRHRDQRRGHLSSSSTASNSS